MSLLNVLIGFFIIKGILLWPLYYWKKFKPLSIGFVSSLAVAPLITLLYHDTNVSFWPVYFIMILMDIFIYFMLLQRVWWKATLISFFLNTVAIIYFFVGNG